MQWTAKGPLSTGIRGRCPRCGKGRLFRGFLKLASCCDVCGLDYGFADPADGPAFFAMTAMSFPIVGFALWFDAAYAPPWWVHLVTTLPLLIVLCALPLRPLKGWLVCSQYFYKAEEGRLAVTNTSSDVDAGGFDREEPSRRKRISSSTSKGD
jgi:uncharacterized protein (DUF983 family)